MLIENTKPNTKKHYSNFIGSSLSIEIAEYLKQQSSTTIILANDSAAAIKFYLEMKYLLSRTSIPITYLPTYEILPYDHFSASGEILSQRLSAFYKLLNSDNTVIVMDIAALSNALPSPANLTKQAFQIKLGQVVNITHYVKTLDQQKYINVNQVNARGEYSIRGNIIDIFPMGSNTPYRIELFDDVIETIRSFDVTEQISAQKVEYVDILPAHEINLDHESLNLFCSNWQQYLGSNAKKSVFYKSILDGNITQGIESYTRLFYENKFSLFDYINSNSSIIHIDNTHEQLENVWSNIKERYNQLRYDLNNPILSPDESFLSPEEISTKLKTYGQIHLHSTSGKLKSIASKSHKLPDLHIHYQYNNPYQNLQNFHDENKNLKFIFSAESKGRIEVLLEHLKKININPVRINSIAEAIESKHQNIIIHSALNDGFIQDKHYCLITEISLFKNHVPSSQGTKKHRSFDAGNEFRDLAELAIGDAVVHINHGVGRYEGLTLLQLGENKTEFLTIIYANEEKLYVPINSLHFVSRYSGANVDHAPINRLGSDKWDKIKEKTAKKIQDVAADLLEIYAHRATKVGFSNSIKKQDYLAFCDTFPFEETEDQVKAINDVITDMLSNKPMDRLICGDVGFGKTEIAMRATFISTHNNKQVAILVPTTLLAQQHYENFQERFSDTGAQVEVLSRFKTAKQQQATIANLKSGKVDIIIGTHKLLSKDIGFLDLGLLIIDEEHRFGVTHKEKIKSLRANIDILTMTATP
ncbi:MAG: transcription-repair coupling factor (superfamily II helicase), partial [Francisellaceae bacterium]